MSQDLVIKKLAELEVVKKTLKKEFIGIDSQIDQIVNSIKTWYCFPDSLTRPLIVNLWGITGTFKTSLIRRLVELLKHDDSFKEIDARKMLDSSFSDLLGINNIARTNEWKDSLPSVLLIDEFQNIKTIGFMDQDTKDAKQLHELFSLLSDGKIKFTRFAYSMGRLKTLIERINNGEVNKSITKRKAQIEIERANFQKVMEERSSKGIPTLNSDSLEETTLSEIFWDLNYAALDEFQEFDYRSIIEFGNDLEALFKHIIETTSTIKKDITLDLSKSLLFVAGNLDNLFEGLTSQIDTESITPDEFYEMTTSVNFNDVKNCLLQKFRPEQVSRLGTNHVIFPSFNTKMYKRFISKLTKRSVDKFKNQNIKITIDPNVEECILKNAAIPSQGVRSVISAHEFVIDSNLSELISLAILHGSKTAKMKVINNQLHLIVSKEKVVRDISIIDSRVLVNYPDPINTTICVHEAGHAIAVIALTGRYPEMIKVRSNDSGVGGYVRHNPAPLPTKNDLKMNLAISMAGYAAEMLTLGEENVSSGASSDILNATSTASLMVKVLGFGDGMSANGFSMSKDSLVIHDRDRLDQEVDDLISEAFTLACTVLLYYKDEHKKLSNHLKTTVKMTEKDIKNLLKM